MMKSLDNKSILLVISGGIAAYKSLELIRLIRKNGGSVRAILTEGGAQFVTPLSVSALCEEEVFTDLWSIKDETEMGHIRLSREADVIIIAPASADIIGKLAQGRADDLATTTLLAANKPILLAPAMNHKMWDNPATQDNIRTLQERGVEIIGPDEGDMACGEFGMGRMREPEMILGALLDFFHERPLKGLKAIVTAGPTFEPIDPVRFIGNRSSGIQGYEIASALHLAGADVTLVSGPVSLKDPAGIKTIRVETALEMLGACENAMPAEIAVCCAAVADWAPEDSSAIKLKKRQDKSPPTIKLKENPDILKTLSSHKKRPALVIGFSAETHDLLENAQSKLLRKGCDWILANDVANEKVFGKSENHIHFITQHNIEDWKKSSKAEVARKLVARITEFYREKS